MPLTKTVSLSDISVLNTVRTLQLDTNVHIIPALFGFHYWLRDVDRGVVDVVIRILVPVVGDAVATERVTCSRNITVWPENQEKYFLTQNRLKWRWLFSCPFWSVPWLTGLVEERFFSLLISWSLIYIWWSPEWENVILNNGYQSQQFRVSLIFLQPSIKTMFVFFKKKIITQRTPYQFIVVNEARQDVLLIASPGDMLYVHIM